MRVRFGGQSMFGFKRRAEERRVEKAAARAALHDIVLKQIAGELVDVTTSALRVTTEPDEREHILATAESIRHGIDAVLLHDLNAFGPEMLARDKPEKAGGMIAHAARNIALLTGALNHRNVRGDICCALGFEREAF